MLISAGKSFIRKLFLPPQLPLGPRVQSSNRRKRLEDDMKRAIAGMLLLVGMSVAPALASDRGLRRDIRHDEARIVRDRHELHREYRDLHQDRRDLYWR